MRPVNYSQITKLKKNSQTSVTPVFTGELDSKTIYFKQFFMLDQPDRKSNIKKNSKSNKYLRIFSELLAAVIVNAVQEQVGVDVDVAKYAPVFKDSELVGLVTLEISFESFDNYGNNITFALEKGGLGFMNTIRVLIADADPNSANNGRNKHKLAMLDFGLSAYRLLREKELLSLQEQGCDYPEVFELHQKTFISGLFIEEECCFDYLGVYTANSSFLTNSAKCNELQLKQFFMESYNTALQFTSVAKAAIANYLTSNSRLQAFLQSNAEARKNFNEMVEFYNDRIERVTAAFVKLQSKMPSLEDLIRQYQRAGLNSPEACKKIATAQHQGLATIVAAFAKQHSNDQMKGNDRPDEEQKKLECKPSGRESSLMFRLARFSLSIFSNGTRQAPDVNEGNPKSQSLLLESSKK